MYLDGLLLQKEPPQDTSVVWGIPNGDSVTLMIHVDGVWRPINGTVNNDSSSESGSDSTSESNNNGCNCNPKGLVIPEDAIVIPAEAFEDTTKSVAENVANYISEYSNSDASIFNTWDYETTPEGPAFTFTTADSEFLMYADSNYFRVTDGEYIHVIDTINEPITTTTLPMKFRYQFTGSTLIDALTGQEVHIEDVARKGECIYCPEAEVLGAIFDSEDSVPVYGLVFNLIQFSEESGEEIIEYDCNIWNESIFISFRLYANYEEEVWVPSISVNAYNFGDLQISLEGEGGGGPK